MKLRIKGNSIRFRLTKSEVDHFGKDGKVEEVVELGATPDKHFRYVLHRNSEIDDIQVAYQDNGIAVSLPEHLAFNWVSTERVGIEEEKVRVHGKSISVLIEKDFQCLHREASEEPDNYANPQQTIRV